MANRCHHTPAAIGGRTVPLLRAIGPDMRPRHSPRAARPGRPARPARAAARMAIVDRVRTAWMRTVRGIIYAYGGLLPAERAAAERGFRGLSRATLRNHCDGRLGAVTGAAHAALMGLAAASRLLPVSRRPSQSQVNEWMEVLLAILNGPLVARTYRAHERYVRQALRHHRALREGVARRGGPLQQAGHAGSAARRAQRGDFAALRRVVEHDCAAECRALDQAAASWPPDRLLLAWERILEPFLAWRPSGLVETGFAELLAPARRGELAGADAPPHTLRPKLRALVSASVRRETFLMQGGLDQRVAAVLAPYTTRAVMATARSESVDDWAFDELVRPGSRARPRVRVRRRPPITADGHRLRPRSTYGGFACSTAAPPRLRTARPEDARYRPALLDNVSRHHDVRSASRAVADGPQHPESL